MRPRPRPKYVSKRYVSKRYASKTSKNSASNTYNTVPDHSINDSTSNTYNTVPDHSINDSGEAYIVKNEYFDIYDYANQSLENNEDAVVFELNDFNKTIIVASKNEIQKNINNNKCHKYLCENQLDTNKEDSTIQDQKVSRYPFIKIDIIGVPDFGWIDKNLEKINGLHLDVETAKSIISENGFIYMINALSTFTIDVELYNSIINANPPPKNLRHSTLIDAKISGTDFPALCVLNQKIQIKSKRRMTFNN